METQTSSLSKLMWLSLLLPKGHVIDRTNEVLRYTVFGLTLFTLYTRFFSRKNTLVVGVFREDLGDDAGVNRIFKLSLPFLVAINVGYNAKCTTKYGVSAIDIGLTRFILCRRHSDNRPNTDPKHWHYAFELASLFPEYALSDKIARRYDAAFENRELTVHTVTQIMRRRGSLVTTVKTAYVLMDEEDSRLADVPVVQRFPLITAERLTQSLERIHKKQIISLFNVTLKN